VLSNREGNHRAGIVLATRHILCTLIPFFTSVLYKLRIYILTLTYELNGQRKGDEHPAYTLHFRAPHPTVGGTRQCCSQSICPITKMAHSWLWLQHPMLEIKPTGQPDHTHHYSKISLTPCMHVGDPIKRQRSCRQLSRRQCHFRGIH